MQVLSSIYDPRALRPENAHDNNVQAKVDEQKLHDREFTKLWQRHQPQNPLHGFL